MMRSFRYHTPAICDRCGLKYQLGELSQQVIAGVHTNLMVCPRCLDDDHPQQFVNRALKPEDITVDNPRPGQQFSQLEGGRFDGIRMNMPSHTMIVRNGGIAINPWGS